MSDQARRAGERSMGPGGMPPRDPRDLLDAGPALRIEESRHPAGPALEARYGRRPVVIAPDEPVAAVDEHRRALGARADLALLAMFIAALFFLAGATFYLDGSERGDALLVTAGTILLVIGVSVLLAGLRLRRSG